MSWIDQRPDDATDGAFTAVGPEPISSIEPAAFREAMSRLGAAVLVVTTVGLAKFQTHLGIRLLHLGGIGLCLQT